MSGWSNIYEKRRSHGSAREYHGERTSKFIPSESEFTLRGAIPKLARSKSSKQPNISNSFLKTLRRKIGEAVPDVYLDSEYQQVLDWVNGLKTHWKELGATLMCDGYFLNPQFRFGVEHSENVLIETLKGTRSVIERLEPSLDTQLRMINQLLLFRDKHETFDTPQAQRAWKQMNPEKENSFLDGENVGVLSMDTSDDEMNVDQSQQKNLSHSSSSAMPSQSGNGPNGGSLSPIDDDDGHSGDKVEIRSSNRYGGEYGVRTTSGHFRDISKFDGNMFPELRRGRSEPRAPCNNLNPA
ncbi:hypothetical protein CXB51_034866 [Gossypium anomalum]|uniref:Uncharacterized protein n=1 Tax=Gossypium anomalum TaxID=47600 RepID=A0A8J6CF95_9ROSI|nr:hypothetical protein CXB51_034866 [Gossypium anomalum]